MRIFLPIFTSTIFLVLAHASPIVPCYFIFGDSLSDPGNNNALLTAAKANYPPYGIDFPGGVTGRFTNGRTFVDKLTQLFRMEGYIAPFRSVAGSDILKGVNYASASSGIRLETGSHLGDRIWLDRQLLNHVTILARLLFMLRGSSVSDYLNKCLYTVNIGSNDYINNYFMPDKYSTQRQFSTEQYATQLADQYNIQLRILYGIGARKVAVFGIAPIGCVPAEILRNNATQCVDKENQAVQLFNKKLVSVVDNINAQLPGAKFTFIDYYAIISMILAAVPPGASPLIVNATCCTALRSDYQCEPYMPPCPDRSLYAFMDGYHPTEVVNGAVAMAAFSTNVTQFVHPLNISALVAS